MDGALLYLTATTAIASALVGGVLYAFSAFVMAGLKRLPAGEGMAAMQSINVTAVRPGLMLPFFGTAIASVVLAVVALVEWDAASSGWALGGRSVGVDRLKIFGGNGRSSRKAISAGLTSARAGTVTPATSRGDVTKATSRKTSVNG